MGKSTYSWRCDQDDSYIYLIACLYSLSASFLLFYRICEMCNRSFFSRVRKPKMQSNHPKRDLLLCKFRKFAGGILQTVKLSFIFHQCSTTLNFRLLLFWLLIFRGTKFATDDRDARIVLLLFYACRRAVKMCIHINTVFTGISSNGVRDCSHSIKGFHRWIVMTLKNDHPWIYDCMKRYR